MKQTQLRFFSFVALLTFSLGSSVWADEAQLVSLVQNMESQMQEMQKTIKWQGEQINKMGAGSAMSAAPAEGGMKIDEKDFDENLKRKLGDSDKWLKGLKFNGDFRLRYEGTHNQNKHNGTTTGDNDRNRFRFRLRFGFEKELSDEWKVGFRLVSGPHTNAGGGAESIGGINSTNQTLDNNFDFKTISIDRAYATYLPKWAQVGIIKQLEITGGKFKNPFEEGSSLMIWDSDVTPEGVYEAVTAKVLKTDNLDMDYKLTAGQMVLEEGSGSERDDAFLMAFQTGFITKLSTDKLEKPIEHKIMFSYYDWGAFAAAGNFQGSNGNPTCSGGTTLCAKQFNVIEIYNEIAFEPKPLPKTALYFDWAANVNDRSPAGVAPEDANDAWGVGIKIGKAKKKGTWEASYAFQNIESNSTPGIFSDSDFGHADRRGSIVRFGYAITDNLVFNTSAFYTNAITSDALSGDNNRQLYQADLVWKI